MCNPDVDASSRDVADCSGLVGCQLQKGRACVSVQDSGVGNTSINDAGVANHEREANGSHLQPRLAIDLLKI
jgi:hypothetical protein